MQVTDTRAPDTGPIGVWGREVNQVTVGFGGRWHVVPVP